jgi:hypothetical protein
MFPPYVPIKKYSEKEIEDLLESVEEDLESLEIHGYMGTPLAQMQLVGYCPYDPTRWRALMARSSNVVRWSYPREDGEIMFVDYWDPPGSRWVLAKKRKPIRW